MMQKSTFTAALAALTTALAAPAAPAAAADLYVGSPNTAFASVATPGGTFQTLGACGGEIAALAADSGDLYLAATTGQLYHYRSQGQFAQFWLTVPGAAPTGLAIRGHEVSVATQTGRVVSYDRAFGTVLREWNSGLPATTLAADRGDLFQGTEFGAVLRLDDGGGFSFLGSCGASVRGIAASANELYLASVGATVWRIDRTTGGVIGSFPIAAEPTGVAYDGGVLYVSSDDGIVRTYSPSTGAAIGSHTWGFPISALTRGSDPAGNAYCFGEFGVCPCGSGDLFGGCPSYLGIGARLESYGSASVASDDFELAVVSLPPTTIGRFYMGASVVQVPFGNGLLCAGAGGYGQFRFPVQHAGPSADSFGAFRFGPGIVAHSQANFGALGAIHPGSTWRFQAWFRDVQNSCGGGFNTSSALSVTFQP